MKPKKPGLGKLLPGRWMNRWIGNKSRKGRFATAIAISKRADFGIEISQHAISWRLNEIDLNSRVASTKPYISKKNKMSRLKFATEHAIWTEEQRNCVHFSDELKFNLFGYDGSLFVRHGPRERYSLQGTKSSVKFGGGSVMVFGIIANTRTSCQATR